MSTIGGQSTTSTATGTGGSRVRIGGAGQGFDGAFTERVRLYLKVTFLINLFFACAATIIFVSGGDGTVRADTTSLVIVYAVTSLNGMVWFLTRKSKQGFYGTIAIVASTTLMLCATYTHVATSNDNAPVPAISSLFALIVVAIILVLRSSLIPTPAPATAVLGLLCMGFPISACRPEVSGAGWVFALWSVVLALVIVAVTTVTSHIVYGVERRVHAATRVGQYQVERLLGQGGMGEVYLAKHALLNRPTAIKLLRDASASSSRDRFRQEVQTASSLTHPNTVEIYDYGRTPEGLFYFAMEYVEGATLEDVVLCTGAMPPARVIHLLMQAAGSLGEAHQRGLVHRDIKPSNLMLCERGGLFDTLKVMDFGLVHDLSDEKGGNDKGLSGTPLYLSPEAILQADGAVPQSDVYALGATAYFMLHGAPPFGGSTLVDILSDHLATEPPPLECDDVKLVDVIMRCLAKDPGERPHDAKALATELEQCASRGQWSHEDAAIWWAEHHEIVDAYRPNEQSLGSEWSSSRAFFRPTGRSQASPA